MIIKIFDTFNAELKNIWDDCFIDSNSTIFQEYQWLYHWHITFSDFLQTKLYINVIYKNNTVIGILPLCINNRNKLSILEWIGVGVSDYLQPIIKSKEKITIEISAIKKLLVRAANIIAIETSSADKGA